MGRRLVFKSGGAGARQQHRPRATERDRSARGVRTCREVAPGARSRAGHSLASLDRAGGRCLLSLSPACPSPSSPQREWSRDPWVGARSLTGSCLKDRAPALYCGVRPGGGHGRLEEGIQLFRNFSFLFFVFSRKKLQGL